MFQAHICHAMRRRAACGRDARASFSLVETALAMLVVALGMLTILSLFPTGLDQCKRFVGDTHSGMFAQEVLSALRAEAETNWDNVGTGSFAWAASDSWSNPSNISGTGAAVVTNIYTYAGVQHYALRYQLLVEPVAGRTNSLKCARLSVWSEQFGATNTLMVFYMEFFRNKP